MCVRPCDDDDRQRFVNESVVDGGPQWVERFWTLVDRKRDQKRLAELGEEKELPGWLQRKPG